MRPILQIRFWNLKILADQRVVHEYTDLGAFAIRRIVPVALGEGFWNEKIK